MLAALAVVGPVKSDSPAEPDSYSVEYDLTCGFTGLEQVWLVPVRMDVELFEPLAREGRARARVFVSTGTPATMVGELSSPYDETVNLLISEGVVAISGTGVGEQDVVPQELPFDVSISAADLAEDYFALTELGRANVVIESDGHNEITVQLQSAYQRMVLTAFGELDMGLGADSAAAALHCDAPGDGSDILRISLPTPNLYASTPGGGCAR